MNPIRTTRRTRPGRGYPRPQLQRQKWTELNGKWDFAFDPSVRWTQPHQVHWDRTIQVPFAPETPASGINDTGYHPSCWYHRTFSAPRLDDGQHLLLHFGAVDYEADIWVNGRLVIHHEGGYTPFCADITHALNPGGRQTLIVHALDDPHDLAKPRGKQDWQPEAHSIWYPRTSGIWQTVWMETVPSTWIGSIRWTPDVERWEIGLEVQLAGRQRDDLELKVRLIAADTVQAEDRYHLHGHEIQRRIALADPGIDDQRNELLWYPDSPRLIDAELELLDRDGRVIDSITSYTAIRGVSVLGDRLMLNGKPCPLRMVLDQGYWPQTGMTAPDDDALRHDVELAKAMGFNGVRKHQKIEDPRYLFWADKLGLLVWEEMPGCYRFTPQSVQRLTGQWSEAIHRDISHPCIIAWVPFNESWGVPNLPDSPAQQHCIQAIYHLTRTLDPTRPVIGNDGWEAAATDIIGIHDYDADPQRIAARYGQSGQDIRRLLACERPGHKILLLSGFDYQGQPIMLTEFGGIAFSKDAAHTWGYSRARTVEDFSALYAQLLNTVRSLPMLAGFCYTQFADTYQEANGLLYSDRTPKFPINQIACATRGPCTPDDEQLQAAWRKTLLKHQRIREKQSLIPPADLPSSAEG